MSFQSVPFDSDIRSICLHVAGPHLSNSWFKIYAMQNAATLATPELFTPEVMVAETPVGNQAREFVRWCCSLGDDFRNSPDATNLQFWARKTKSKIAKDEEAELLAEARRLFLKKVEQHVRKTAAAVPSTPE